MAVSGLGINATLTPIGMSSLQHTSFFHVKEDFIIQVAPEAMPLEAAVAEAGPNDNGMKVFTMEEVARHDTRESAWFVHRGEV